jgi:hypothetical protein
VAQVHKRSDDDRVGLPLKGYCQALPKRAEVQQMPSIGRNRFFALAKACRHAPEAFTGAYERRTQARLPAAVEMEIERGLLAE